MKNRAYKLSHLFHTKYSPKPSSNLPTTTSCVPKRLSIFHSPSLFNRPTSSKTESLSSSSIFSGRFTSKESNANPELKDKVSILKYELLLGGDDVERVEKVLEEKGVPLFRSYSDGSASAAVELLDQLAKKPVLALQVLGWRRRQVDYTALICSEEYVKGIAIAGRLKNVDLADELFQEACNKELKTTNIYNALMSVYMYNRLYTECQELFLALKKDASCRPTLVTYNILISVFGRSVLTDSMEKTFKEIEDQNLSPDLKTYNNMIAGYVTAWDLGSMEKYFLFMHASSVEPNFTTYKLILRGYANAQGDDNARWYPIAYRLTQMEEIFELMGDRIADLELPLIKCIIRAYRESSDVHKVTKVEELLMRIPGDYRHWLNAMLITLYAKECMLEKMESAINEAFGNITSITTAGTMRCIICCYFRCNAADRLAEFVKRAEVSGWKINRSLYHCKMVMYSAQRRLTEMEGVLQEMDKLNMGYSKKTFWILYKAYKQWDQKRRVHQVVGTMCTLGYGVPLSSCS